GTVEGQAVLVGSHRLLTERGLDATALAPTLAELEEAGATTLLVGVDGRVEGILALRDTLKEGAAAAVRDLKGLGLTAVLLTGDNARAAAAVARRIGIEQVIAEARPEEKAAAIARLQAGGAVTAMVGDGINDAPALARADVGIAMGTGTDVAMAAADITLVSGDLRAVARAIALSRATMRVIRQNLFWAFAYNVVLIPLAAVGLIQPIFAAAAMACSSVSVIANSLRLGRFSTVRE
ncbi:MAG: HAD-IC family P-type ATPase, partial [Chloroflexota bacterium]